MTARFAEAGCRGWFHVRDVVGPGEVGLGPDEPVVAASVIKVLIALEFFRQVEAGRLDPAERAELRPGEITAGPTGFSTFTDDVNVSLRDLARMMLVVSDNAATDVLLDRIGLPALRSTAAELSLRSTVIAGPLRELLDSIGADLGFAGWQAFAQAPEEVQAGLRHRLPNVSAVDPERTTRTTPRDMTSLLTQIWRDEAGPPPACAEVRRLMAAQVTRHRLAAGFPAGVGVSAKSGSLLGVIRNEIGVIEHEDGTRYAAAVFTRAETPFKNETPINTAIGTTAAEAVNSLRP